MRFLFLFVTLAFVGFGCINTSSNQQYEDSPPEGNAADQIPTAPVSPMTLEETLYVSFIINVHDFSQSDESIATLHRIIDLHEREQLPVDIYLTDAVTQIYEEQDPALIERLKTSPYVAVSHHIRPPTPYYADFHDEWFDGLSETELEAALREYETREVELVTGKTTTEPGGYQHLSELMGYPPYVVTHADGSGRIAKALANVYKEMGALCTLVHGTVSELGDTSNGLCLRPEDVGVKVYEPRTAISAEELLEGELEGLTTRRPAFINLKWHENNFYSSGTNWGGIYYVGQQGSEPRDPPYDLSLWTSTQTDKSDAQEAMQWQRYEDMLRYVKTYPERFTVINARDMTDLLAEFNQ